MILGKACTKVSCKILLPCQFKCNESTLLKEEVEKFGQQCKILHSENRKLEHLVKTLKDSNVVSECINALFSLLLNLSKDKLDQVILNGGRHKGS